jgi:hypothetical protein
MSAPAPPVALLTETVDARAGIVRARGHLTRQGADLLCGTIETLHAQGHRRIVLDLRRLDGADAEGDDHLDALILDLAADHRLGLIVRRGGEASS